ncbi:ATP-binding protein [Actinocorallia sp. B10E7]|uniref:ATP-binding protein n=1 Tax=Actinocorallia sp. B10E7 TaxID=3153558 RepID=UPI00325F6A0B
MTDGLNLRLLACPTAARLARTLITRRITQWGCTHRLDDVLLVASELITNASKAAPNSRIRLRLNHNSQGILISVWDPAPALPIAKPAAELTLEALDASPNTWDNGGGWGLPLVLALSSSCGHHPVPSGGKWVWASLDA